MFEGTDVNVLIALLAGAVSFVSPCVLPLIPSYLAYLAGVSIGEIGESGGAVARTKRKLITNAVGFVLGFSLVFILFGLSASAIGQVLLRNQGLLRKVSGIIIITMGLHTMGVLRIPALYRDKRVHSRKLNPGPASAFLFGVAFSAGWTPCIGPILASILMIASSSGSVWYGGLLLAAYSLGLGLPLLLSAVFFGSVAPLLRRLTRYLNTISVLAGALLVILGTMVFFNSFARLAGWIQWGL